MEWTDGIRPGRSACAKPPGGPNSSMVAEAKSCLDNQTAIGFFDGCSGKCITNMTFFKMSFNEIPMEAVIYGKMFPVLVFFVVLANVMVAVVLSKKHMVTPTNVVLRYMAIADLFVGLAPLPWTLYFFTFGNADRMNDNLELWWCYMSKNSMDSFPPIFHNIAMWLTVLLASQRYISISYPLHSRSLCSVKNVRYATAIITIISTLCGVPKMFDFYYAVYDGYVYDPRHEDFEHRRACLMINTQFLTYFGPTWFFNVYYWIRAIFFVTIPCTFLIILNALLIREIRKAQLRKLRLLQEKRAREAQKQTDTNSTSLMLVVIVSIFLIVNLPQAIFMVMLCIAETFNINMYFFNGIFPATFLLINNMLVMASYPINFGIYCFMSSSFRQTFRALFCKRILLSRPESSMLADSRKVDSSGAPLMRFTTDVTTLTEESMVIRSSRRNHSVFL